jgi:hypothetical protein
MTDMISISRASLEQIYKVIGTHLGVDAAAIMAELPVIKSGKVSKKVEKVEKKPFFQESLANCVLHAKVPVLLLFIAAAVTSALEPLVLYVPVFLDPFL